MLEQKELPPNFLDGNPGCLICTLKGIAIPKVNFPRLENTCEIRR